MRHRNTLPLVTALVAALAVPAVPAAGAPDTAREAANRGRTAETTFVGNNFFDGCDEAAGDFDLKKFSIVDDKADDLTFYWGTCPQSTVPLGNADAIAFFIDEGRNSALRTPTHAIIQHTGDATWTLYDAKGTRDESRWVVLQEGTGTIATVGPEDGGPRNVGTIQVNALQADFPVSYQVALAAVRDHVVEDVVPEPGMPPLAFPDSCAFFEFSSARVEVDGPRGLAVAAAAVAGIGATAQARRDGSRLVWPVDDAQLAALDALPGVAARRPAVFRPFADPEPTTWAVQQLHLDLAWDAAPRAPGTIAVLDQGVDGTRPDLVGRVGPGVDAITGATFAAGTDSALGPHGTSVSGIAVGNRDNDLEVAGVNDGATILPIRVFDHASCADDSTIAAGLDAAIELGADVVNLSLGGPTDTDLLHEAIIRAADAGVILIAATGNNQGEAPGEPNYPAAYPEVIGIGATGPDGVAAYSQRAGTEFVAPGGAFTGQRDSDYAVLAEWNRVEFQAGTSWAAPVVAGLVSLWLDTHPGASMTDLRVALQAAAVDLPDQDGEGFGLLDASLLLGDAPPAVPAAPAVDGDPATSHRLDQDQAIEAALAVSALRVTEPGTAPVVVIARSDTFADALSGAPLTRDGPLLLTTTADLDARVRREVQRVLAPAGTVYVLGGPNAVAPAVEDELRATLPDATVQRLAGPDRFQTSRQIVTATVERFGVANQILLARGFGPAIDPNGTAAWADAIAGAALAASRGWPLLIVRTQGLDAAQIGLIDEVTAPGGLVDLLGGPNALSERVAQDAASVRAVRRIAGTDRDQTAARIATDLWGVGPTGPRPFTLLNIRSEAGWYLGLASAGYGADLGAPTLSVNLDTVPPATAALLGRCGVTEVEVWVAGAATQVSQATLDDVDRRDGAAC